VLAALLLAAASCAGCGGAAGPGSIYQRFQDEDPSVRAAAAAEAAGSGDPATLSYLVDRLGDPEPDVRLMADAALRKRTGPAYDQIGWRFYESGDLRAQAQRRWRDWLRSRGLAPAGTAASSQAASTSATSKGFTP
jgi:hypothetical protein